MKKNRNIKKIIKKRIEIKNNQEKSIVNPVSIKKTNPKLVTTPTIKKRVLKIVDPNKKANEKKSVKPNNNLTKFEKRNFIRTGNSGRLFGENYSEVDDVVCDVVILISSYNRYKKVTNLIKQLYSQETKYTFKIVLLNDGSSYWKYRDIPKMFPELIYLKNEKNGGKMEYWKSINKLFDYSKHNKSNIILQIDDDYILCDNYLNLLCDKFFQLKKEDNRYIGISFHKTKKITPKQWGMDNWVDGGTLFDYRFIDKINFKIDEILSTRWSFDKELSSGVWNQVSKKIEKMKLFVYNTKYSLVKHDGNYDSKMNKSQRDLSPINTWGFIDDKKEI